MDNAPSSTSGYAGEKDTGDLVKEQVSQGAQQAMDKTQQVAGQVTESAKSQARSAFESQKQTMTQNLTNVAQALHTTSDTLEQQNMGPVGSVIDTVANRIEGTSGYIQQRSMDELLQDAENYARQHTWAFLGGGFVLGLAAARFLKSSAPRPNSNNSYRGYGNTGGYGGGSSYGSSSSYGGGSGYGSGYGSYGSSYPGGTDYESGAYSSPYGSGSSASDVSMTGTPGLTNSFGGGTLTETDVEATDVVFEPDAETGAIDGTTTESR
jgi:ElaB/YqjD/DUF883 family membrane-anchored ribosome-binding protein